MAGHGEAGPGECGGDICSPAGSLLPLVVAGHHCHDAAAPDCHLCRGGNVINGYTVLPVFFLHIFLYLLSILSSIPIFYTITYYLFSPLSFLSPHFLYPFFVTQFLHQYFSTHFSQPIFYLFLYLLFVSVYLPIFPLSHFLLYITYFFPLYTLL